MPEIALNLVKADLESLKIVPDLKNQRFWLSTPWHHEPIAVSKDAMNLCINFLNHNSQSQGATIDVYWRKFIEDWDSEDTVRSIQRFFLELSISMQELSVPESRLPSDIVPAVISNRSQLLSFTAISVPHATIQQLKDAAFPLTEPVIVYHARAASRSVASAETFTDAPQDFEFIKTDLYISFVGRPGATRYLMKETLDKATFTLWENLLDHRFEVGSATIEPWPAFHIDTEVIDFYLDLSKNLQSTPVPETRLSGDWRPRLPERLQLLASTAVSLPPATVQAMRDAEFPPQKNVILYSARTASKAVTAVAEINGTATHVADILAAPAQAIEAGNPGAKLNGTAAHIPETNIVPLEPIKVDNGEAQQPISSPYPFAEEFQDPDSWGAFYYYAFSLAHGEETHIEFRNSLMKRNLLDFEL